MLKMKKIKRLMALLMISILLFSTTDFSFRPLNSSPTLTFADQKVIEQEKSAAPYPSRAYSIHAKEDEYAISNRFYYLDNMNRFNVFFWEMNPDTKTNALLDTETNSITTACRLYQEQKDGSMKSNEINWTMKTNEELEFSNHFNYGDYFFYMYSIRTQWIDENNGDLYIIAWYYELDSNPTRIYGIHPNGELFINETIDPFLVMDINDWDVDRYGFSINYLGQKNGVAYFDYKDKSKNAVVYYDMKKNCFTKQIFTDYTIKGIINNQYVGVNNEGLVIGSIPEEDSMTNASGKSIVTGQSEIKNIYQLPEYKGLCVNQNYVYMITDNSYQRMVPGEGDWEVIADVSKITADMKGKISMQDLIAKDKYTFTLLMKEDGGEGYYFDVYHVPNGKSDIVSSEGSSNNATYISPASEEVIAKAEKVKKYPKKVNTIHKQEGYSLYYSYRDNKNLLNAIFCKNLYDEYFAGSKYPNFKLYQEQKDGSIKEKKITLNKKAKKILNFDNNLATSYIHSLWINEKNGDLYIIINNRVYSGSGYSNILYGIHPNGEVFINIKLEDYLVIDPLKGNALVLLIHYIGQKNGVAYFNYEDESKNGVVYFDMNKKCFTKQVFTDYTVKGIINNQLVGVNHRGLVIGSIPEGTEKTNKKGNSIVIGQSDIKHVYTLPKYRGLYVNGKYVYLINNHQYQRIIPGNKKWEGIADVSKIPNVENLWMDSLSAKDKNSFTLYTAEKDGIYIDFYHVK